MNRNKINVADPRFRDMSSSNKRRNLRGDTLGCTGQQFREDLLSFCGDECRHFMAKRASVRDLSHTGTSISGIAPGPAEHYGKHYNELLDNSDATSHKVREPFPLRIYTSTMPRAVDTVNWEDFKCNQKSNLNPLDKGDCAGMELDEIKELHPEWYRKLEEDPFRTRYVVQAGIIPSHTHFSRQISSRSLIVHLQISWRRKLQRLDVPLDQCGDRYGATGHAYLGCQSR